MRSWRSARSWRSFLLQFPPPPSELDRVHYAAALLSCKTQVLIEEFFTRWHRIFRAASFEAGQVLHLVAGYLFVKVRCVLVHHDDFVDRLAYCKHVSGEHHPCRVGKVFASAH